MARRTKPAPTKVFPLNIDIPREEAIALGILAMETALTSWRRKRIQWSSSMLRTVAAQSILCERRGTGGGVRRR